MHHASGSVASIALASRTIIIFGMDPRIPEKPNGPLSEEAAAIQPTTSPSASATFA